MARTPTAAELEYVGRHTRAFVNGHRPRNLKFWGESFLPVNTLAPVVSGTGTVGQTLSTTNGTWTNSPTAYIYRWLRNGVVIAGAAQATYVLQPADAGTVIASRVTATNQHGDSTPVQSSNSITVAVAPPTNTTAPVATGTGTVGQTLSCTTGAWTGTPTGYTYRWQRNAADIVLNGGTSTYTLIAADSGTNVRCTVIAANAGGNSAVANSNAIAVT